jgi:hypothetical protein
MSLTLRAYFRLVQLELLIVRDDFQMLYRKVRNQSVHNHPYSEPDVKRVCLAMDTACIWYWKEVLCLQRSAATTCLLKQFGIPATMIIGALPMPFRAHAWVEVSGRVVNDKPYVTEMYTVIDRV